MAGYYLYNTLDELIEALNGEYAEKSIGDRLDLLEKVNPELRSNIEFFLKIHELFPDLPVGAFNRLTTGELYHEIQNKTNKEIIIFFNIDLLRECENNEELFDNREFMLQYFLTNKNRGDFFSNLSARLMGDRTIIEAAVRSGGCEDLFDVIENMLSEEESKVLIEELVDDKEFILQYMSTDGNGVDFKRLSKRLQEDPEVILAAINSGAIELKYDFKSRTKKIDFNIFEHIPEELKNNKEFALQVFLKKENGIYLEYFSDELKRDRDVVLAAVKSSGTSLKYVADELNNDRDVVIEAVKNNIWSIKYIGEELKGEDASIFAYGVREGKEYDAERTWYNAEAYGIDEETVERFKNNREIIMAFIINHVTYAPVLEKMYLSEWVSDESMLDRELVSEAMQYIKEHGEELAVRRKERESKTGNYYKMPVKKVNRKDVKDFVSMAFEEIIKSIDAKKFGEDEEIMNILAEYPISKYTFREFAADKFKSDHTFALKAVSAGYTLEWFDDVIKDDDEIVTEAVKANSDNYQYASLRLKESIPLFFEGISDRTGDEQVQVFNGSHYQFRVGPYTMVSVFNDDIMCQIVEMPNGEDFCWDYANTIRIGNSVDDAIETLETGLELFVPILDKKLANPDIKPEEIEKIQKAKKKMTDTLEELKVKLRESLQIMYGDSEVVEERFNAFMNGLRKKLHSSSEVAELDGVKTSDIEAAFQETIKGKDISKDKTTQSIDE